MNYPFLGYNTPGLQLGQAEGLGGLPQTTTPYTPQDMNFNGNMNAMGANPTFNSIGESMGMDMSTGNYGGGGGMLSQANNWMSNNADLLKSGIGLLTGGMGAWNGMQQNKLMRQNMNQQAGQFREQMDLSKQNLNRNIEDRQRARVASNSQAYESVDSYMKKYGVK